MKARIVKEGNFWVGQVYCKWVSFINNTERIGWGTVTPKRFTKFGAKIELMKWKKEHISEEFEL